MKVFVRTASGGLESVKIRQEMAAKRPKLELPSMDMLRAEKEQEKSVVSEVKDHLKVLKEAKVQDLFARRLKKLTEENKITWLLAAHSIRTICSVCTVMRSLPVGMTHVQRIRAIARLASVTENEATFMDEFITEECPSLLEVCTSKIAILDFGVIVPDCLQVWGGGEGGI